MTDAAQIYLKTPEQFDLNEFTKILTHILETSTIACLRLALASPDAKTLGRAADTLREICHAQDVAIVIDDHFKLAETHGLDGVHLTDGSRSIREARSLLGKDAIIGAFCGSSRHSGITAAEIGVDYVSFGPLSENQLGSSAIAPVDIFKWWSEMIEIPVVAEGGLNPTTIQSIKDIADFVCVGTEIWGSGDPKASLDSIIAQLA